MPYSASPGTAFSLAAEMPETAMAPAAIPTRIAPRARARRAVTAGSRGPRPALAFSAGRAAAEVPMPSLAAVASSIARRPARNSGSAVASAGSAANCRLSETSGVSCSSDRERT